MQGGGHVTPGLASLSWPVYGDTGLNMHVCGQEMHDCNDTLGTLSNVSVKKKDPPPLVPFLEPSLVLSMCAGVHVHVNRAACQILPHSVQ